MTRKHNFINIVKKCRIFLTQFFKDFSQIFIKFGGALSPPAPIPLLVPLYCCRHVVIYLFARFSIIICASFSLAENVEVLEQGHHRKVIANMILMCSRQRCHFDPTAAKEFQFNSAVQFNPSSLCGPLSDFGI